MAALSRLPLIACALSVVSCSKPEPVEHPDILFLSLDSVRADDLTFLDEALAPNMARLARRGTVFTQALSGTSWTLPSHAQMFTGNPPLVNGVQIDTIRIDPLHTTLPEALKSGGYWNAGYWTGWYLADGYGFGRGFDVYENSMTTDPEANTELRRALEERGDSETAIQSLLEQVQSHRDITSNQLATNLVRDLGRAPGGTPRFLFGHFFDPHYDYVPPAPFDTLFDPDYTGDMTGSGFWDNKRIFDETRQPPRQISDRDLEHVRALYRGEIAWTDRAVGRILDELEARGTLDRTLIVITSDHGEEFFEHGGRGHRFHLFDEVLRIPLLIVPPGAVARGAPRTVEAQVTLSDLMPTMLDFAGVDVPANVHGRSLRPLLEGGSLPSRPAVSSLLLKNPGPEGRFWLTQAVRTPERKVLCAYTFEGDQPVLQGVQVFDLLNDPGETRTIFRQKDLGDVWSAFENDVDPLRRTFDALPHSSSEERGTRTRESFAADLSALGYADDGADEADTRAPKPWLWSPPPRLNVQPRKP